MLSTVPGDIPSSLLHSKFKELSVKFNDGVLERDSLKKKIEDLDSQVHKTTRLKEKCRMDLKSAQMKQSELKEIIRNMGSSLIMALIDMKQELLVSRMDR